MRLLAQDPLLPALLVVLVIAAVARCVLLTAHATEEDFFITLRYARNIAAGHGFVYNLGEPVLGTTTPLYTLGLALSIYLRLDPIVTAKLLGIGADLVSCLAAYSFGRTVGRPGAGLAAALCLALLPTNLIWATKGMEVELVAASAAVAWAAWAAGNDTLAWAAAGALAVLRIDGLILAPIMLVATLIRSRRIPWRGLVLFTAILLPWLLFASKVFGSPIPASLQAKLIVYGRGQHGRFPRLLPFLGIMTHRQGAILALGWLFALCAFTVSLYRCRADPSTLDCGVENCRSKTPPEWLLIPAAVWVMAHYAGMAFSKVFLFGWYFVPPTPIYYLVAMVGWNIAIAGVWRVRGLGPLPPCEGGGKGEVTTQTPRPSNEVQSNRDRKPQGIHGAIAPTALAYAGTTAAVGLALGAIFVRPALRDLQDTQAVEDRLRVPIGIWLRDHARPGDRVMLEPIGYIGYLSGLRVLDTVGLVSPEVLPCYAAQVPMPYHAMWKQFRPDWILLRAGEWNALQRYELALPPSERLVASYRRVRGWRDPAIPNSRVSFSLFQKD